MVVTTLLVSGLGSPLAQAATPNWDTTGTYVAVFTLGGDWAHDMSLTQDGLGNLTGGGGYPAGGPHTYEWLLTSGSVSGDTISFTANYTMGADALTPPTTMHVTGTIAPDGSMSGTWTDDYQGGSRAGTWHTSSGTAKPIVVASCPVGTTRVHVETIPVNSAAVSPVLSSSLTNGVQYLFESSGVWQNSNLNVADTAYASVDSWSTPMQGYNIAPYFLGSGEFQLQVNGNFVNWGSYNPAHTYSYLYTGTGIPVSIGVFDGDSNTNTANPGWYGDNSGSLSVDIYTCNPVVPPATHSNVHIFKYLDGVQATPTTANNVSFPMFTSTYNAPFTLGPNGWTTGDIPYEASTGPTPLGASYSANEDTTTPLVGTSCDGSHSYELQGYTTGDSLLAAQQASPSLAVPSFTNMQGEKYIIVWNKTCTVTPPIKVHILKYLDGQEATAGSANNYLFPMVATWSALNIGSGSGSYVLGNNHGGAASLYGADTAPMSVPADYTTSEVTGGASQVVATAGECVPGKYLLNGYRTSAVSFADAATQTLSTLAPVFLGLTSDRYVIVDNSKCPTLGTISGMKYNDLNRNGKKDSGEPGLPGWTIKLKASKKHGDVKMTTVTDANGNYSFTNLQPGTYKVKEVHQKGWKQISKNPKKIVITTGTTITDVDFGNAIKKKHEKEDNDNNEWKEDDWNDED